MKSSNPKHICLLCSSKSLKKISFPSCVVNYCTKCTLQFIKNPVSTNDYFEKYKKQRSVDSKYSKLRNTQYDIDATFLQKYLKSGNVLDVGCSDGIFLSKLNKYNNYNLIGIDPDSAAIEMAKKKFSKINFYNTNLLDFDTKIKFDCIIFRGSFQFLGYDLKKTLDRISEISSKNIKIIIYSLPNSDSILYHLLKDEWHLFDKFSHTLIFNRNAITELCERFDYKIQECSYPYLETPYANCVKDNESLIQLIKGEKKKSFPFWGNIMQIVLEK